MARAIRAGHRRARETPSTPPPVDGVALRNLLVEVAADAQLLRVTINRPRWTTTKIATTSGEQVTWLAWGRARLVKPLPISVEPHFALAGRVHGGQVHASEHDTYTYTADHDGNVELASLFPGELRPDGSIATDRVPYRAMRGGFTAIVVTWPPETDPRSALQHLAERDPTGLCAAEAARLANPPNAPAGWHHHPLLRPAATYTPSSDGVTIHAHDSVGIVQRPVDVPLTPTLRLRWSWRLDQLPSTLAEDTTLTHDYLSIAVAFDDGRDLTWHWSCALPEGLTYRCPFDHWRRRETHIVVRSGTEGLGRWTQHERPVLADHQAAIGGPPPTHITAVWLIACTFLQGRDGRGAIGPIELADGGETTLVLGPQSRRGW
jgi:hypothetical protein